MFDFIRNVLIGMLIIATLHGLFQVHKSVPSPVVIQPQTAEEVRVEAVRQAARTVGVDSVTLLQVSRQENWTADPYAWSPNGCCVGLMQVNVRVWYGAFDEECGGSDLLRPYENACYGAHIYKRALQDCKGRVSCALGRYVGATTDTARAEYVRGVLSRSGE